MKIMLILTISAVLVNFALAGHHSATHLVDEHLLHRVASILSDTSGYNGHYGGGRVLLSYPQKIPLVDSYHTTYASAYSSRNHHGNQHAHPYTNYPPVHNPYNDVLPNYGPPY